MTSQVNLTQHLIDFDGTPIDGVVQMCQNCGKATARDEITLRTVCLTALDHQKGQIQAEEKFQRFRLAMRIVEAAEIDLTAAEITMLKELIGQRYRAWIMGQAWEMLEPSRKGDD